MSTDPGPIACSSWTETVEHIELRVDDVADSLTITVDTSRAVAGQEESFGIDNVRITPLLKGYFDRFDDGPDEWGTNGGVEAQTSSCGFLGQIMGGAGIAAQGVFFEKRFDLQAMPHDELHIGLIFVAIDTWDNERAEVSVDGVVAWAETFTSTQSPTPMCGQQGVNDAYADVLFSVSHYSNFATLRISTTLDSPAADESFGIDDVRLIPMLTGVDRPGYVETFETSVENWITDNPGTPPTLSTCESSGFGAILGGFTLAPPPAFLQKAFDLSTMPHNELQVSLDFVQIDQWVGESTSVSVDRQVLWSAANPAAGIVASQCTDTRGGQWSEARLPLALTMDHHGNSALLRVEVSPNPAGVHWGIDNLRLIPVRHGYFDDFESPRELAEWSGSLDPLFTTHCGDPMNSILGGFRFAGVGAYLERSYDLTAIPHNIVRVSFDFYKIDSWDGEAAMLLVNGEEEWRQTFSAADGEPLCGATTAGWNEQIVAVDLPSIKHDGAFLTLRVATELNSQATDESFGIDNVSVEPMCTTQLAYAPDGVPVSCLAPIVPGGGGGH